MSDIQDPSVDDDDAWRKEAAAVEHDRALLSSQPRGSGFGSKLLFAALLLGVAAGLWRFGTTGHSAPAPKSMEEAVTSLVNAVRSRLRIMPEVAYSKFHKREAVDDHEQEERVIRAFVKKATEGGLDPALAEEVIRAQIEAAKLVQRDAIAQWELNPPPESKQPMDIVTELRPTIDRHTNVLIQAMASIKTFEGDWRQELRRQARERDARPEEVSEVAWTTAWRPFIGALSTPQLPVSNGNATPAPTEPAPTPKPASPDDPVPAEILPE